MKGLGIVSLNLIFLFLLLSSCNNSSPTAPVAKPNAPTLSAPANEATDQPTTMTLTWSTVSNAASYHIQVSTSSFFSPLVAEDSSLATATKTLTALLNGTIYYWRVRAKNAGGVSAWTETWNFTTLNYVIDTVHTSIFQNNPPEYTTQNPTNWYCNDVANPYSWLYHFNGNLVVISQISTTITVDSIINDTTEIYRGVFTLDSSVTPNAMDIHLITPQYQGQTIQTLYAFQPIHGSFINCFTMINTPGAARPDSIDQTSNSFLNLRYYQ